MSKFMDLSLHDVKKISVKATYVKHEGVNMKVVKIEIDGMDNWINLHCTDDVEIDVSDALARHGIHVCDKDANRVGRLKIGAP